MLAPRSIASEHVPLGLGRGQLVVDRPHGRRVVERVPSVTASMMAAESFDRYSSRTPSCTRSLSPRCSSVPRSGTMRPGWPRPPCRDRRPRRSRADRCPHLEQQLLARRPLGNRSAGRDRADEPHRVRAGVRRDLVPDRSRTVDRFTTPVGRSAASRHSASRTAQTEVVGAGAHTTVFPYAIDGARISPGIVYGQFGLMTETTPRGIRCRRTRLSASTEGG